MPDEAKPQSNSKPNAVSSDKNNNRSNQGRSNYKGRNNRTNNRPNNKPATTPKNPFEVTAAYHTDRANFWRRRVNGFSMFTVIYGALLTNVSSPINTQLIAGLILTGFTLIFLIVFSARNYMGHKANIDTNRYRQNILITAEDMAKGTRDIVTKEEIMLESLAAIGDSNKS